MGTPSQFSTDDAVIRAIRGLVEAGEHLDQLYGVPTTNLSGGGAFRLLPDGRGSRIYARGSREHLEARSRGLVLPLEPPPAPPSPDVIADVERSIGYRLPRLLRRLYEEVGNGGFGPGYGLLGLSGGWKTSPADMRSRLEEWRTERATLLPICDWGCGILSLLEYDSAAGMMWGYDPNPVSEENALFCQQHSLREWWAAWLTNKLYQPTVIQDPVTGVWRGATDQEVEAMLADAE